MTIFDSSPVSNYSTPSCRLKAGGSATGVPWNPTPTRAQPAGIIIAIGSNQPDPHWGNPADIVACCVRLMPSYGLAVVRHSRILVTAHVPAPTQADRDDAPTIAPNPIHRFPDYHNAVVEIATPLP
ncbi:MAG: 2-amino-4-hydroxy-6-hydroxymethyldihydropteridine diphosphokinase, partial [Alphaproteobacteria bacterium]|nr:2-amino-4-hydroxy-6-hydroxymethyldihydropteridine diphosphokinase [Alphaproteobacteria bacterium]